MTIYQTNVKHITIVSITTNKHVFTMLLAIIDTIHTDVALSFVHGADILTLSKIQSHTSQISKDLNFNRQNRLYSHR